MRVAAWAILVFVAVLAYVIAINLDQLTMAVVIGVIFGVLASVPASLFLLFTMRRAQLQPEDAVSETHAGPQVVYIVWDGQGQPPILDRLDGTSAHTLPEVRR